MTSPRTLNLKLGDIVLVNDNVIGIIRHIGYVQALSNGKYDDYIGIEIKYRSSSNDIGIPTNGEWMGHVYFSTSQDKGRFVKEQNITKQFSPEQLFDSIHNKAVLIKSTPPDPEPEPEPKPELKPEPEPEPKPKPNVDYSGDIGVVAKRLNTFLTPSELKYFISFCNEEDFTALDDIEEDLDVFEGDDSAIIDAMKKQFKWNQVKIEGFVNIALNRMTTPKVTTPQQPVIKRHDIKRHDIKPPKVDEIKIDEPEKPDSAITIQYDLPKIWEFIVPQSIMKQRDPRSINDIILCLKKNKISNEAILRFKQFCKTEGYKFVDLATNLNEIRNKFKNKHRDLIVFIDYIEKCIYELSPPLFRAGKFTKMDEDNKHNYFESQCKGVIKHDRDLLQYFCILEHTENELPSELIDIADRCAVEEKQELNVQQFGKKYFFRNCDKIQISKVKSGLRKYHSRFLPLFPKNPLKQIADKISGYQKYCILLSLIIDSITRLISDRMNKSETLIPFMIDMMILPPGCFNKVEDANTKTYDSSGPIKIGDIKKRLKDFDIPIHETRGLNDKTDNFDIAITQRIIKQIMEYIKKLTNNFKKKNQRICILIDRRWRMNCKKFDAFNKLRKYGGNGGNKYNDNDDNDDIDDGMEGISTSKHKKSSSWITKGWFGGGSGGYDDNANDGNKGLPSFYNNKHDTIYVYQPNLGKKGKKTSYHEFNNDFCHETLIYLTKQCIIPRKDHYMHIGGDTTDGWLFNISAHIKKPKNALWYKYEQRWYVFLQSAALRFFPQDMNNLWPKYFVDSDEDTDKLTYDQIMKLFKINLQETDSVYKRWYYAIKRSD